MCTGGIKLYRYVENPNKWLHLPGLDKSYGKNVTKRGNPKDAQKKMCKGQESREIDRIDAPQSTAPGSQWHAQGKGKMMVQLI